MNDEQVTLWNGVAAGAWIDNQALLDRVFEPIENRLLEAIGAGSACNVLDVGCGTGATTIAIARRLGPAGRVVGVDLSKPMTDVARARAQREGSSATFVCADAQTNAFEGSGFDRIISRFGVMFFDDPVQAFANLRRAAHPDATLDLFVWRSADENPFMTTAERAASPYLPNLPVRRKDEPGQFAFGDAQRVRRILEQSGWSRVDIRPVDVECTFAEADLVHYFTRFGPLGRVLQEAGDAERSSIIERVRGAFDPFVQGDDVRFTGACWRIGAGVSA